MIAGARSGHWGDSMIRKQRALRNELLVAAILVLFPGAATATGVCENTPRRYPAVIGFAAASMTFAVEGTQEYCEEIERRGSLDERRGTLSFVELQDRNRVTGRLASLRGHDAKRLRSLVGTFERVKEGPLAATLARRGFVPVPTQTTSPNGRCQIRQAWSTHAVKQNGFPAHGLALEVYAGAQHLARFDIGVTADELRKNVAQRAVFLVDRAAVAVWVRLPQCVGGPPPGYFQPGDSGDCYAADSSLVLVHEAAKHKELAVCFSVPSSQPVP
jgi:hypothetical protein